MHIIIATTIVIFIIIAVKTITIAIIIIIIIKVTTYRITLLKPPFPSNYYPFTPTHDEFVYSVPPSTAAGLCNRRKNHAIRRSARGELGLNLIIGIDYRRRWAAPL